MRHRKDHRKLSRTHSHRRALLRNLATSLIEHERIDTTLAEVANVVRQTKLRPPVVFIVGDVVQSGPAWSRYS